MRTCIGLSPMVGDKEEKRREVSHRLPRPQSARPYQGTVGPRPPVSRSLFACAIPSQLSHQTVTKERGGKVMAPPSSATS